MTVRSPSESDGSFVSEATSDPNGGSEPLPPPVLPPVDDARARRPRLLTVREGALFAGLLAGIARRVGIDAGLVRVPFAVVFLAGLLLWWPLALALALTYLVAWLAIPQEDAITED